MIDPKTSLDTASATLPPIDIGLLASLRDAYGDETFLRLRQIFLDETLKCLARLSDADQARDYEAVRSIAHRMVSLLGAFGARAQAELARDVTDTADNDILMQRALQLSLEARRARDAVLDIG